MRQSYQTIRDMQLRNQWLKKNGYNPSTFFNPDLDVLFIRAKAAIRNLLDHGWEFLSPEELALLIQYQSKKRLTNRQIYQILNLNKRIKRLLYRYSQP